jgi:hypothetical protein
MTKRESILQQVMSALAGTTGVSTRIYRSRAQALSRDETPGLLVEPISDIASHNTVPRITWDMTFAVTVIIRDDDPDSSADAIIDDLHSKIMSSSGLAALVVDLQPIKTDWQFIEADQTLGIIINQFKVTYQTALNDLASI